MGSALPNPVRLAGQGNSYPFPFTSADIDASTGLITITHGLGVSNWTWNLFDNAGRSISPDYIGRDPANPTTKVIMKMLSWLPTMTGTYILVLMDTGSFILNVPNQITGPSATKSVIADDTGIKLVLGSDAEDDVYVRDSMGYLKRIAMAASRFFGKKATGGAGALTGAEALTIMAGTLVANKKLFINAAGDAGELDNGIQVISFTHDMAATGAESVTNVNFQPKGVILISGLGLGGDISIGFSDGVTTKSVTIALGGDGNDFYLATDGNKYAWGRLTMQSNGFSITWQKAGSPTGTRTIYAFCLR
jgi:hypothetical protein